MIRPMSAPATLQSASAAAAQRDPPQLWNLWERFWLIDNTTPGSNRATGSTASAADYESLHHTQAYDHGFDSDYWTAARMRMRMEHALTNMSEQTDQSSASLAEEPLTEDDFAVGGRYGPDRLLTSHSNAAAHRPTSTAHGSAALSAQHNRWNTPMTGQPEPLMRRELTAFSWRQPMLEMMDDDAQATSASSE